MIEVYKSAALVAFEVQMLGAFMLSEILICRVAALTVGDLAERTLAAELSHYSVYAASSASVGANSLGELVRGEGATATFGEQSDDLRAFFGIIGHIFPFK